MTYLCILLTLISTPATASEANYARDFVAQVEGARTVGQLVEKAKLNESVAAGLKSAMQEAWGQPVAWAARSARKLRVTAGRLTVAVEVVDARAGKYLVNNRGYVYDRTKPVAGELDAVLKLLPQKHASFSLFPEAHAEVVLASIAIAGAIFVFVGVADEIMFCTVAESDLSLCKTRANPKAVDVAMRNWNFLRTKVALVLPTRGLPADNLHREYLCQRSFTKLETCLKEAYPRLTAAQQAQLPAAARAYFGALPPAPATVGAPASH